MDDHDAFVQDIYDAATDPAAWARVPEHFVRAFGTTNLFLSEGAAPDPRSFHIKAFGFDDTRLRAAGFGLKDHFDNRFNAGFDVALVSPLARGFDGHRLYDGATRAQKVFFRNCFRENGTPFVRSFLVKRDADLVAGGFMAYDAQSDFMFADNRKRFDTALAHLRRAVEIRSKLEVQNRTAKTLGRRLDALNLAAFVIDRSGRVVYHNAQADELARTGTAIRLHNAILRATDNRAQRAIDTRLRNLHDAADDTVDGPLPLPQPHGQPPLLAWVYPAIGFGLGDIHAAAHACILIRPALAPPNLPDAAHVAQALDFTPAEARVVRLTPLALNVAQMAARLRLSPNTVKTHLSSARQKLGLRRTEQLSQMVDKLRL